MEWRLLRGWSEAELVARLERLRAAGSNFTAAEIPAENGWRYYFSEAVVGHAAPSAPAPGGPFDVAKAAVAAYRFSDPRIVVGHFDPDEPLCGRRMLLEIKVLGLHYLSGVVVTAVRSDGEDGRTVFGFRYDTLEGHIEKGYEWFLLSQEHETGEIRFRIQAVWRPGDFPNWWSRLGFRLLARRYQRAWHRLAYLRLRTLLGSKRLEPLPPRGRLLHVGPELPGPGIREVSGERRPSPAARPETEREGVERRRAAGVERRGTRS